jgi:hypothetical protein
MTALFSRSSRWFSVLLVLGFLCGGLTACGSSNGDDEAPSENGDGDGDGDGDTGDGDGDTGDGDGDPGDGDGDNGDGDGDVTVMEGDDNEPVGDDLDLYFNPMYSAYDGEHDFKIPAIVQGVQRVRWSALPADAVDMVPDSATGGVLITTRKPGTVKIIARAGLLSGSADLFITDATPADWATGNDRYNNMIPFPEFDIPDGGIEIPDGGFGDGGFDAGGFTIPNDLSCRNCHGAGAEALDVEHTPQQTGGYSDEDLINIFTAGTKPPGAQFHTAFPESIYVRFHTWDATDAEKKGIVVYLRSLEPKSQGELDFGGLADAFGGARP